MAKLFSYYGLCPLIDQKSFLGLSEDKVPGCVIVTLGKKIVIRYKLSDQKQISSWSTKDMLTTSVVYDEQEQQYVAGFLNNQLRVWLENENNLDKVKKYKFQKSIHTLLRQDEGPPIVIFKDGSCCSVKYALNNKKSDLKSVLEDNVHIKSQSILNAHGQIFLCLITEDNNSKLSCVLLELEKENYTIIENSVKTREITRKERHVTILGYVIIPNNEFSQLMTIWSDGRIFLVNVFNRNDKGIGNFISVFKSLSISSPLTMLALSSNYVAIYGPDISEEGASLIIFNIQFKIMQSRQQFKLFSKGAEMFSIGNSILLAAGQGVAVVPFQLAAEQLASIVGSQKDVEGDDDIKIVDEMKVVEWSKTDNKVTEINKENQVQIPQVVPTNVAKIIKESVYEGLPETSIADLVFPMLMESNNIPALTWCLNYFKDIKESLIINLLHHALTSSSDNFEASNTTNGVSKNYIQPVGRRKLVNKILQMPVSEAIILPHLRKKLAITETVQLLQYMEYLLNNPEDRLTFFKSECDVDAMILKWSGLLIDSHYQEIMLSRDQTLLELLVSLRQVVKDEIAETYKLKKTEVLMQLLKDGKSIESSQQGCTDSRYYSIESIELY